MLNQGKPSLIYKKCYKCGLTKPAADFGKRQNNHEGYDHECRECKNAPKQREKAERMLREQYNKLKNEKKKEKPV